MPALQYCKTAVLYGQQAAAARRGGTGNPAAPGKRAAGRNPIHQPGQHRERADAIRQHMIYGTNQASAARRPGR
jgi:hypothetical protein